MIKVTVTTVHADGEPEARVDTRIHFDSVDSAVRLKLSDISMELAQEFAEWKARLELKLRSDLELQINPASAQNGS